MDNASICSVKERRTNRSTYLGSELWERDEILTDQSAKMHLDEGIKAVKAGDNQGALMHLGAADKALGGSGG